jgi:isopentenyl-diphosphate delta-isomerase
MSARAIKWQPLAGSPIRQGGTKDDATDALTIVRSDATSITLRVRWLPNVGAADAHEAQIEDQASAAALQDLLNLVRKDQHIAICETQDVEASDRYTGLSDVRLLPNALPELAWSELVTTREFLGRTFAWPFLITGMTGGVDRGAAINRRLARAASAFGIPMGVGSQRLALENPAHAQIFTVKDEAPDVFLIANLGIAQLMHDDAIEDCRRAVAMIGADAIALHVNIVQELVQVEGDRDFRGVLAAIATICAAMPVPVVVKEVGAGIDPRTAARLLAAGVAAIDVGGSGGTSWSFIEGARAESPITKAVAMTFRDWGIPTGCAVAALKAAHPRATLIATGGIRDGLMAAKAIALGATMAGIGLPLFRAALQSDDAPLAVLETMAQGLKTAMLASGAPTLADLATRLHITPEFVAATKSHLVPNAGTLRDQLFPHQPSER